MRRAPAFFLFNVVCLQGGLLAAPPSIASISPRGAQRGQTVTLIVEGANLTADAELVTRLSSVSWVVNDDPNLKPAPAKMAFRLTLNANEAPAPQALRVRTREGLSNPVLFVVGILPEASEEEPNDVPAQAKPITPPVTVNGRLGATDRDTFKFSAKAGERLVFEVEARRLGSAVDPTLHLLRQDGREIALSEDAYGIDVDSRIDYTFREAGEYLIQVHDAMYLGRSPDFYRLKAGNFPYADAVFPLGGRAGSEVQVWLDGGNLESSVTTRLPLDPDPLERWTYVSLPLPLDSGGGIPFPFKIGTLPETFEGPREKVETVLPFIPSTTLNGRIEKAGEVDRYSLDVAPGQRWVIRVEAASLGSWLDPLVAVLAEDGKRLAQADDEGTNPDPRFELVVPENIKKVVITVEDLHRRGGKAFSYRLTVTPQQADFQLKLNTAQVQLPLKGTALIEVECVRLGYAGPVRLSLATEPVGFTVRGGGILPDQNKGYLTLTGPDAGNPRSFEVVVNGTGGTALEPITRRAQGTIFLANDQGVPVSPLPVGAVMCAVVDPPVLSVKAAVETVDVVVGHSAVLSIAAARKEGVAGEIKLTGIHALPGLTIGEGKVPADKAEGTVQLSAAPNAALRDGEMIVAGTIKVNNADIAVPTPIFRARVVRPFAVELASGAIQAAGGSTAMISGKIARVAPFVGKVDIKVDGLAQGMTAAPVTVAPDKAEFQVQLMVPPAAAAGNVSLSLVLSTPLGDPNQPVVHALPPIPVVLTIMAPAAPAAAKAGDAKPEGKPEEKKTPADKAEGKK
jgi:hypothetical protein